MHKKLIRRPGTNGKSIVLAFEGSPPSAGRVATVPVTDGNQGKAYAAQLVQAWNHYPALVDALKGLLEGIEKQGLGADLWPYCDAAKETLKAAGEA